MADVESGGRAAILSGIAAVLAAAASWGASGIFVKFIMAASPVTSLCLAFWRDAAAFVVFFALALKLYRRRIRIRRGDWPQLAGMGICLGIFHVALNAGYRLNGAAVTTIQQAAMPAIVLAASRFIWKEPLSGFKVFSLVLIAGGTVLVSGIIEADAPDVDPMGILVGFLVPALYAGWSLFGKALRGGYNAVVTLTWAFGIAALILLPFQLTTGDFILPPISPAALAWFAGLIGLSTVFAFFIFTYALGRLPAGVASILVMSEIVFAVVYAHLLLGEVLTPLDIIGA
ncbi:MAG TPA: DMT family transporter [Desulfosarcina sp.]|nr:DMT family transporter [Desulfosarcina sp.]